MNLWYLVRFITGNLTLKTLQNLLYEGEEKMKNNINEVLEGLKQDIKSMVNDRSTGLSFYI